MNRIDAAQASATFRGRATSIEWPTAVLGVVIVGCYAGITLEHRDLPVVVFVALLAIVTAWWSSFQHELLHGHPFPNGHVNDAIGSLTLSLWVPYRVYKATHLRHHRDQFLTDPFEDPESFYCDPDRWRRASSPVRALMWVNRTFLGRMVIGPGVAIGRFLSVEVRRIVGREESAWRDWLVHCLSIAVTLAWAFGVAKVPAVPYLLGTMWFGTAVMLVRSFAEHLWRPEGLTRSAFVEGRFPFGLLFLFNNMHHAHHARPTVPWYELPRLADHLGSRDAARDGAGYYRGYREVVARFGLRPFCVPVDPATPEGQAMLAALIASNA